MKPPLFVRTLTVSERQQFQAGLRSPDAFTVRRCQILLASDNGLRSPQIARNLGCARGSVRNSIHAFHAEDIACLREKSSRPYSARAFLGPSHSEALKDLLHRSPRLLGKPTSLWTLDLVAEVCHGRGWTPRRLTGEAIRVALKRLGIRWRRAKRWITSPDPAYARRKTARDRLIRLARAHSDWVLGFQYPVGVGPEKAWLWVAVTRAVTVFLIRRHRDRQAFDDLVGPEPGVMTTDRYSVYAHLDDAKRQVCWAHLRRDFQAMIDRRDRGSGVGEDLLMYAEILAEHWPEVREGRRTRDWFAREILPWLRQEVRHLLDQRSRCGGVKTAGVCRELLAIEASLWSFASREGVEPTNNVAERAVRHAVCWRKTSYGTDGERGSRFVERMLSVVASCRSQGRDVMDFLTRAITAGPDQTRRPSILPTGP